MEKLYDENGNVAVAVSYGYGAGWSTWNSVSPLDKRYNELILKEDWEKAKALAKKDGQFDGGLEDCCIEWLTPNTPFTIGDYDGSESLRTLDYIS